MKKWILSLSNEQWATWCFVSGMIAGMSLGLEIALAIWILWISPK